MSAASSTDSLFCEETLWDGEDSNDSGRADSINELHAEGIRSLLDRGLIADNRVLENVLNYDYSASGASPVDYFETVQTEIKPHMRKIVCEWMLEVCEEQQCQAEVFPLAVDYMDRVLSKLNLRKGQFQLLGATCIFVASKFKESSPVCADKLVVYTDFSVSTAEITVSN